MPRTGSPSHEVARHRVLSGARAKACANVARNGVVTITIRDQDNPDGTNVELSSDDWHKLKPLLDLEAFGFAGINGKQTHANTPDSISSHDSKSADQRGMNMFEFFRWLVEHVTQSDLMLFRFLILVSPFVLVVCLTVAIAVAGMPPIVAGGIEVGGTVVAASAVGISAGFRRLKARSQRRPPGSTGS